MMTSDKLYKPDSVAKLIIAAIESPGQIGNAAELEIWVSALFAAWSTLWDVPKQTWRKVWRDSCKHHGATSVQSLADVMQDVYEVAEELSFIFTKLKWERHSNYCQEYAQKTELSPIQIETRRRRAVEIKKLAAEGKANFCPCCGVAAIIYEKEGHDSECIFKDDEPEKK